MNKRKIPTLTFWKKFSFTVKFLFLILSIFYFQKAKSSSPELTEDEAPNPRNREILSLDIPLNETGSAGLGVSVKGQS